MATTFLVQGVPVRSQKPVAVGQSDMHPVAEELADKLLFVGHTIMLPHVVADERCGPGLRSLVPRFEFSAICLLGLFSV